MPERAQAGGESSGMGPIAHRPGAYPPQDPRARVCRRDRDVKAPAAKRACQAVGVLTTGKAAKLHHPSSVRERGAGLPQGTMCGRFPGLQAGPVRLWSGWRLRVRCRRLTWRRRLRGALRRLRLCRGRRHRLLSGRRRAERQGIGAKRRLRSGRRSEASAWRGRGGRSCGQRGACPDRPRQKLRNQQHDQRHQDDGARQSLFHPREYTPSHSSAGATV